MSWQNDIEKWTSKHRKTTNGLSNSFIKFFELAFENTRYPQFCWFGVHKDVVSLVIGGIFMAAINLRKSSDFGAWLLLDRPFPNTKEIEFTDVKSTRHSVTPLTWGHIKLLRDVDALYGRPEIWQSFSEASEKILNAKISTARNTEFQRRRNKARLSDIEDFQTSFEPRLPAITVEQHNLEVEGYFDPGNLEDARQRRLSSIVQRQGQPQFRRKLLDAYGGRCPMTDCDVEDAIEAAHISPYLGAKTNHVKNGLPLRADIHTLFDLHFLSINPDTFEIVISPEIANSHYQEIAGRKLAVPKNKSASPDQTTLANHYKRFLTKRKT